MKSKYIKLVITRIFSLSLLFGMLSCSDFLDKQPTAAISDATFWNDENDAKLALAGCYRFPSGGSGYCSFGAAMGCIYLDCAGGNGTEKENFAVLNLAHSSTPADSWGISDFWSESYKQIAHCNTFLDNIVNCPMDEVKKTIWIAEVKMIRSYFLYYLAFHFKDVPMPLTTLTVSEANTISATPQDAVYAQIEKDLKESIPVLLDKHVSADFGRVTKGAARVLLSRLYLGQNKWSEAAATLADVINSGYTLDRRNGDDSYDKLFMIGGENSPETIFSINYVKDRYVTERFIYQKPEGMNGWHQFCPHNELVKEYFVSDGKDIETSPLYDDEDPYANRDLRLYATVFLPPLGSFPGSTYNGKTYDCYNGANTNDSYNRYTRSNGYCLKKGCDPATASESGYNTYVYQPLMRYAEVLLAYLEAINESKPGSVTQDLLDKTINDVRNRVKLPPILLVDVSSPELLRKAVRKERRVELAFEGLRYWDILRWGIGNETLNHTFTGVKLSDDPNARNYRGSGATASAVDKDMYYEYELRLWDDHNRYFPIPQNVLNINKNLVQNPGYN
jgi:hypothetical protein